MAFSPTELAVLEAFVPRLRESDDGSGAWVCEDEGKVACGQGSTAERAQESWLAALATALLVDVEQRRRAEARAEVGSVVKTYALPSGVSGGAGGETQGSLNSMPSRSGRKSIK